MKKILLTLLVVILFSCCGNRENQEVNANGNSFTRFEVTDTKDSTNIQYNIHWFEINYSPVDIRIITLKKDGETHDYVVANNYIGRAGGLAIDHWVGCKCLKNNK